jgi:hypothetical protein
MTHRIAILGWGSLIWAPRSLPLEGAWQTGGPALPVEFSRISADCRLTLVVDSVNGAAVPTRYALSPRKDLDDAIRDLKEREGTTTKRIGYVELDSRRDSGAFPEQVAVHDGVAEWARSHGFSAVIWTALPTNFAKKTGRPFSVQNASEYLRSLPESAREVALKYIGNAPEEVMTPLRREIISRPIPISEARP